MVQRIAARWSTLTADVKALYEQQAAADKQRYDQELREFRNSDSYKEFAAKVDNFQNERRKHIVAGEVPSKPQTWLKATYTEMRMQARTQAKLTRKQSKLLKSILRKAPQSSGFAGPPKPRSMLTTCFMPPSVARFLMDPTLSKLRKKLPPCGSRRLQRRRHLSFLRLSARRRGMRKKLRTSGPLRLTEPLQILSKSGRRKGKRLVPSGNGKRGA
jgi:hypothetical protein